MGLIGGADEEYFPSTLANKYIDKQTLKSIVAFSNKDKNKFAPGLTIDKR